MKLAEALMERKALRDHIEQLKQRLYHNAQVQEGEVPAESPAVLLAELDREVEQFRVLVTRINMTNTLARLPDGRALTEAIAQRDMLHLMQIVCENLATKAAAEQARYSKREIKMLPTVDVPETRKRAESLAREARLLDLAIQNTNWNTELS